VVILIIRKIPLTMHAMPTELEANVYDEVLLPELVPLFNMFSDAGV
jgi:hypothetical protein